MQGDETQPGCDGPCPEKIGRRGGLFRLGFVKGWLSGHNKNEMSGVRRKSTGGHVIRGGRNSHIHEQIT